MRQELIEGSRMKNDSSQLRSRDTANTTRAQRESNTSNSFHACATGFPKVQPTLQCIHRPQSHDIATPSSPEHIYHNEYQHGPVGFSMPSCGASPHIARRSDVCHAARTAAAEAAGGGRRSSPGSRIGQEVPCSLLLKGSMFLKGPCEP